MYILGAMSITTTPQLAQRFAVNLRRAIDRQGMTQVELARRSKLSRVAINRILRGKLCPTLGTVEHLGTVAKMKRRELFA